jgi:hypothetical protein
MANGPIIRDPDDRRGNGMEIEEEKLKHSQKILPQCHYGHLKFHIE